MFVASICEITWRILFGCTVTCKSYKIMVVPVRFGSFRFWKLPVRPVPVFPVLIFWAQIFRFVIVLLFLFSVKIIIVYHLTTKYYRQT